MRDPLWERMLVAATGPAVTALLALLVLNVVTGWAQRRRDAAEVRDELADALTDTANALYLALQAFWRKAKDVPLGDRRGVDSLAQAREVLDEVYLSARARGQVLEQRLNIYFASREPAGLWHAVTDLLTVRYFLLLDGDQARRLSIRKRNAGPRHSGLSETQLNDPALLLETYREKLAATIASLWTNDLDRRGRHVHGAGSVKTWHGSPEVVSPEPATTARASSWTLDAGRWTVHDQRFRLRVPRATQAVLLGSQERIARGRKTAVRRCQRRSHSAWTRHARSQTRAPQTHHGHARKRPEQMRQGSVVLGLQLTSNAKWARYGRRSRAPAALHKRPAVVRSFPIGERAIPSARDRSMMASQIALDEGEDTVGKFATHGRRFRHEAVHTDAVQLRGAIEGHLGQAGSLEPATDLGASVRIGAAPRPDHRATGHKKTRNDINDVFDRQVIDVAEDPAQQQHAYRQHVSERAPVTGVLATDLDTGEAGSRGGSHRSMSQRLVVLDENRTYR